MKYTGLNNLNVLLKITNLKHLVHNDNNDLSINTDNDSIIENIEYVI